MDKMMEIAKLIGYPVIFTAIVGMFSGIYGYFQKKREEYRKYIYERKHKKIDALVNLTTNLLLIPIDNIMELNETLLKISQLINPYGEKIKTFGKYQWIKDDGYIWHQMDVIDQKIENDSLELADLKELANRIQISIRLFEVQYENDVAPITMNRIAFYLIEYCLIFILFLGLYHFYNRGTLVEQLPIIILFCPTLSLIFIVPKLIISADGKIKMAIIFFCMLDYALYNGVLFYQRDITNHENIATSLIIVTLTFLLMFVQSSIKTDIFGKSEIGKVSTIYKDEYESLQHEH